MYQRCQRWKVNRPVNEQDGGRLESTSKANETHTTNSVQINEPACLIPEVDVFLAVVYSNQWYIGKVAEKDEEEHELQVKFMAKACKYGETYKWPSEEDEIWIRSTNILMEIIPPVAVGKRSRFFRIEKEVEEAKNNKFYDYCKTS